MTAVHGSKVKYYISFHVILLVYSEINLKIYEIMPACFLSSVFDRLNMNYSDLVWLILKHTILVNH